MGLYLFALACLLARSLSLRLPVAAHYLESKLAQFSLVLELAEIGRERQREIERTPNASAQLEPPFAFSRPLLLLRLLPLRLLTFASTPAGFNKCLRFKRTTSAADEPMGAVWCAPPPSGSSSGFGVCVCSLCACAVTVRKAHSLSCSLIRSFVRSSVCSLVRSFARRPANFCV